jgi:hypothetical protein
VLPWKVVVKVEAHIADGRGASDSNGMYMWWVLSCIASHSCLIPSDPSSRNGTPQHQHTLVSAQRVQGEQLLTTESVMGSHARNGTPCTNGTLPKLYHSSISLFLPVKY